MEGACRAVAEVLAGGEGAPAASIAEHVAALEQMSMAAFLREHGSVLDESQLAAFIPHASTNVHVADALTIAGGARFGLHMHAEPQIGPGGIAHANSSSSNRTRSGNQAGNKAMDEDQKGKAKTGMDADGGVASPMRLPTVVRNRRLRHMQTTLIPSGFFSAENMHERDPVLFHEYVGRYLPPHQRPKVVPARSLSAQLAQLDHLDASRRAFAGDAAMAQSEKVHPMHHHHHHHDHTDNGQQQQQEQQQQQQDAASTPAEAMVQAMLRRAAARQEASGSASASAGPSAVGPGGVPADKVVGRFNQGQAASAIDEEERAVLEAELVGLMQTRFLTGGDGDYVDYAAIDANVDNDHVQVEEREAEEAYFAE